MASEGFPREARIRRRAEFLSLQQQQGGASRIRTASLLVLARRRAELDSPSDPVRVGARLGVVASRRIGGAVLRNRAKRLIREAFRRCVGTLPRGIDVVVIANASTPTRSLADIEREFSRIRRDLARLFGAPRVAGPGAVG